MSESSFPPFLKWGSYTSHSEKNPNELEVEPQEIDTFETEYSINVNFPSDIVICTCIVSLRQFSVKVLGSVTIFEKFMLLTFLTPKFNSRILDLFTMLILTKILI